MQRIELCECVDSLTNNRPVKVFGIEPRTGFEERTVLVNEHRFCYFRVMPVDNQGNDTRNSNEVYTRQACYNGKLFLPFVIK